MGKSSVVFVESGAKVNSEYYCDYDSQTRFVRDIQAKCGHHNWISQQDGALSHTAGNTVNFLHQENITFIEPDMWPPTVLI